MTREEMKELKVGDWYLVQFAKDQDVFPHKVESIVAEYKGHNEWWSSDVLTFENEDGIKSFRRYQCTAKWVYYLDEPELEGVML